jgi:hypothetical protein
MGHFSEFPDTCSFAQEWVIDKMGHSELPANSIQRNEKVSKV